MTGKRCNLQWKLASRGKIFQDVLVTGIFNVWVVFFPPDGNHSCFGESDDVTQTAY